MLTAPVDAEERIRAWLEEDVGRRDITTAAVVPEDGRARATIGSKAAGVAAGVEWAARVFGHVGCAVTARVKDGDAVAPGDVILTVEGPSQAILTAERLALNIVMRCSGIATTTRAVMDRARRVNARVEVLATRKTIPGLRDLDHDAVVAGGGAPHRRRLDEAFLVKENHLALGLAINAAVKACRAAGKDKFVMVEAQTLEEALEAVRAGADGVLLDNFAPDRARATYDLVKSLRPEVVVEVSGGVTLENVGMYAAAADRISLGALTHSAPALDVSLDVEPLR